MNTTPYPRLWATVWLAALPVLGCSPSTNDVSPYDGCGAAEACDSGSLNDGGGDSSDDGGSDDGGSVDGEDGPDVVGMDVGDAEAPPEDCGEACPCSTLANISDLVRSNELYFGYTALGADLSVPDCGEQSTAREVYVSVTPDFDGDLIFSTVHPTTKVDTVIEVREGTCDGVSVGCADGNASGSGAGRLTIPVLAGRSYVAMVETPNDASGVFALGVHKPGVCDGVGTVQEITDLLSGEKYAVSTIDATSSMRGSCSPPADENPEARLTFVPPRSGAMVATAAHPDTDFDVVLYVREGNLDGESYCDSSEAELACAAGSVADVNPPPMLHFDALGGRPYSLFVDGAEPLGAGAATLVLGYAATSPTTQSLLGCNHTGIRDSFAFYAQKGQNIYLHADTVDAKTAADLRLRVRRPDGSELHEADDDVACSFPPPSWSCPEYSFTAEAGLYYVEIYVGQSEKCADKARVNYALTVSADDAALDLILLRDQ